MDFENVLLSKILLEGCIEEVIDLQVSSDLFIDYRSTWNYLLSTFKKHGGVPPIEHVRQKFGIEIEDHETPVSFLVEELQKRWTHNKVAEGMKRQAQLLKAKNPQAALEDMREVLLAADQTVRVSRDVNITEDPESRIADYEDIIKAEGMLGLPSPWPCLDEVTQGFQDGNLIMIAGRAKTGKTWAEVILSRHFWSLGYLPLLFSREMMVEQIIRRFDAVNAQLPFQRFKAGLLTTDEYERWVQTLKSMKGSTPFWVTGDDDGAVGISGIISKVHRYKPRVVLIDGGYLIRDERGGKASWERFANVCWDLKRAARKEDIPIIITHQFTQEGKGLKGDADTLKFGDVHMWFDLILGMYQTEALKLDKEMLFRINAQREGSTLEWVTDWDLEKMKFDVKMGEDDIPAVPVDPDEVVEY
jgi:hypothetical protein